jgi:hypothetical protein
VHALDGLCEERRDAEADNLLVCARRRLERDCVGHDDLREGGEVGSAAAWPAAYRDGLTPAQAAVMEPPYHTRLDRPAPADDGVTTVVPEPRAGFKKDFDHSVFGTTYF